MSASSKTSRGKTKIYPEYWFYNETDDLNVIYRSDYSSGMFLLTFYTVDGRLYKVLANKQTIMNMDNSKKWRCIGTV